MKRILITGVNSYIGTNVDRYLQEYNAGQGKECYRVDSISQRDEYWESYDFAPYDTVLDVTGIAHVDVEKVSEAEKERYYQVNWKLAVRTAQKAKQEGVRQFVYFSSSIVYGDSAPIGEQKHITAATKPRPNNFYGDSKWQAEQELVTLADEQFQVAILRLPFVYGPGCKGNYVTLSKIAKKLPAFPSVSNQRSMIYIENLNEFLRRLVDAGEGGIFFPQNAEYSSTAEMVQAIGEANGRKLYLCGFLNPFVKLAGKCPGRIGRLTNKAFGSLTYDCSLSKAFDGYQLYGLKDSIYETEQKGRV